MLNRTELVADACRTLTHMSRKELEQMAGEIVIIAGMTPGFQALVPEPFEGVSWEQCYAMGLTRLNPRPCHSD